jgi:hypothetical protein
MSYCLRPHIPHSSVEIGRMNSEAPGGAEQFAGSVTFGEVSRVVSQPCNKLPIFGIFFCSTGTAEFLNYMLVLRPAHDSPSPCQGL